MSIKLNEIKHASYAAISTPSAQTFDLLRLPPEIVRIVMSYLSSGEQRELGISCKTMLSHYVSKIRSITFHNHVPTDCLIERIRHLYLTSPDSRFYNVKSINMIALPYIQDIADTVADKFPNVSIITPPRDLSNEGLALIATRFSDLHTLNLSGNDYVTHEGFKHLKLFTNLKVLNISTTQITDETLQFLFTDALLQDHSEVDTSLKNTLTSLHLYKCTQITEEGFQHLRSLSNLIELDLSKTNVTDRALEHLSSLPNLTRLELYNCPHITEEGFQHLRALSQLTELDISENENIVTDATLELLSSLTNLRTLNLFDATRITARGFENLRALVNLIELNVSGTEFSRSIEVLTSLTHLKRLDISGCDIEDEQIAVIGSLAQLERLNLSFTNITEEELERCLTRLENLQTLKLEGNETITSACFEFLGTLPKLIYLNLSVYDNSEEEISEAFENIHFLTNITHLEVNQCSDITDEDIIKLSLLPNLEFVSLLECPLITRVGIDNLIASRHPSSAPLRVNWDD